MVKKTVKKSVKASSKTTTKKKTVSEETSSITSSSKAESFENSFSNGSLEMVEQSITSSKSIDTSTSSNGVVKEQAVTAVEAIEESLQENRENKLEGTGENGVSEIRKKGTGGKKKSRKKRSDEKENISVVSHEKAIEEKYTNTYQHLDTKQSEYLIQIQQQQIHALCFVDFVTIFLCFLIFRVGCAI